jgi:hypothetical protein
MTQVLLATLSMVLLAGPSASTADGEAAAIKQAEASALSWLALIDAGKYGESWDQCSVIAQTAVTRPDWEKAIRGGRTPLGALKSRKVKAATFARTLPGAPDGEYVVIEFDAVFEHKVSAVETVAMMRAKDGSWKSSGYHIR